MTYISAQLDVREDITNKKNIQDEDASNNNEEDEVESEGEFEDGDDQNLVETEEEMDLEEVFGDVPGKFN